jgi:hypothetical protein
LEPSSERGLHGVERTFGKSWLDSQRRYRPIAGCRVEQDKYTGEKTERRCQEATKYRRRKLM